MCSLLSGCYAIRNKHAVAGDDGPYSTHRIHVRGDLSNGPVVDVAGQQPADLSAAGQPLSVGGVGHDAGGSYRKSLPRDETPRSSW